MQARDPLPYFSARQFANERFGRALFRVVVDAGFSCPNRDGSRGTGGCLFCSIAGFRPPSSEPGRPLAEQIARALPLLRRRYPRAGGYLLYFQPYTNTYGPPEKLARALAEARASGAEGVVVATRPDALPEEMLDVLASFAATSFLQVELGVQSTHEPALAAMRRGHRWSDSARAIERLKRRGIRVGAHMILGTPWEPLESQVEGAARISLTGIDAVKIHHLQVVSGSALALEFEREAFDLPDWRAYANLAASFLERLSPRVVVERLFASTRPGTLLAPKWDAPPGRVRDEIVRILQERGTRQGSRWRAAEGEPDGSSSRGDETDGGAHETP